MTQQALQDVLAKMATDPAFVQAVLANPTQALAGFQLTADEIATITSQATKLSSGPSTFLPDAKGMS